MNFSLGRARTLIWTSACLFFCLIVHSRGDELADLLRERQLRQHDKAFGELEKEAAQDSEQQKSVSQAEPETGLLDKDQYKEAVQKAGEERSRALQRKKERLAELGPNATKEQKQEIEKEYKNTLAVIDLDLEYAKIKASLSQDDIIGRSAESSVYQIRGLRLEGNTLIQTEKILKAMPLMFKDKSSDKWYDFYPLKKAALYPGQMQEVTQESIQGLTQYILSLYETKGYGGIYVYVPAEIVRKERGEQPHFEEDILVVKIIEGIVSDSQVQYYTYDPSLIDPNRREAIPYRPRSDLDRIYLKESLVKEWSPAQKNEVFNQRELDSFRYVMNLNPDRYILPVISRGSAPDSLEVNYRIYERSPWHFYVKSDNSGSDERQWNPTFGLINTNLTGRDDRLTAIYQGPIHKYPFDPTKENYAVYSSYQFPVFSPNLRFTLYTGHSNFDTTTDFSGGTVNFLGSGDFHGGILRWHLFQIEDMSAPEVPWFFDLTGSLSHETSNISPTVGTKTDVWWNAWEVGCSLYRTQRAGKEVYTSFSFDRYSSFDGSGRNKFVDARTDADPDFSIYSASAAHSQFFSDNQIHKILASFKWVWPDERLVPAKMTAFGGLYTVRGYEEDEIVTDGGTLFSAQYEFDIIKYLENEGDLPANGFIQRLALLAFTDIGRAENRDPVPGEEKIQKLASVGWGLKSEILEDFDVAFYYGLPLRSTLDTGQEEGRWHFSFLYRMDF